MEKYAVIKLGGKQFLIHEGDVIELERQAKPLKIDVLMYFDGSKLEIGEPEVKVSIKATVVEEKLGKKVRVARFKKKSRYEKVKGHRQPISIIKIDSIGGSSEKEEKKTEEKKTEEKKVEKVNTKEKEKVVKKSEKKVAVKKSVEKKPVKKLKGTK